MIGMHGAGITHAMHMSVGKPLCCGVIEVYPQGEYTRIYGHGNMARKIGVHYNRIDLDASYTGGDGTRIPTDQLERSVDNMIEKLYNKPSCIHPSAIDDPYFDKSIVNVWE
jgi:hypothetical protein